MEKDFSIWIMKNSDKLYEDYEIYVKKLLEKHKAFLIENWKKWLTDRFIKEIAKEKN